MQINTDINEKKSNEATIVVILIFFSYFHFTHITKEIHISIRTH